MKTCDYCGEKEATHVVESLSGKYCERCYEELSEIGKEMEEAEKWTRCYECMKEVLKEEIKLLGDEEHCAECFEVYRYVIKRCGECKKETKLENAYYRYDVVGQGFGLVCEECHIRKGRDESFDEISEMATILVREIAEDIQKKEDSEYDCLPCGNCKSLGETKYGSWKFHEEKEEVVFLCGLCSMEEDEM